MSLVRTGRLIKQSIKRSLTGNMISGPLKLKDAFVNDLPTEDTVYHIQCNSKFWTGKLKKSIVLKTRERHTTADKQCFSKSLNISSFIQMSSFILQFWGKLWKKSWVVIMFNAWFKEIYFVSQLPERHSNSDYMKTNNWLFQQKILRPENFLNLWVFIVVLVFKL